MSEKLPVIRILDGEIVKGPTIILFDEFEHVAPHVMDALQDMLHEADPYMYPSAAEVAVKAAVAQAHKDGKVIDADAKDLPRTPKITHDHIPRLK